MLAKVLQRKGGVHKDAKPPAATARKGGVSFNNLEEDNRTDYFSQLFQLLEKDSEKEISTFRVLKSANRSNTKVVGNFNLNKEIIRTDTSN